MTILEVIENETVARYGLYSGERNIEDGDPTVEDVILGKPEPTPDYIIYCSKYVLEGLYGCILKRGFRLKTYYTPDSPLFFDRWKKEEVKFVYQLPKLGVIQIVPNLMQGYVIEKFGLTEEYKIETT